MTPTIRIGIIGDFNPHNPSHIATNDSLAHAARSLSMTVEPAWLSTVSLERANLESALCPFDALWCSPGSPYQSMEGALRAIRFAREHDRPFVGT